mmetsp:Transcript_3248/g.7487  ORF Transcript_3248/g.7487 Transcript_3248/m.7487 type:complete len:760 (+) Transcript_3248:315-2594(+)
MQQLIVVHSNGRPRGEGDDLDATLDERLHAAGLGVHVQRAGRLVQHGEARLVVEHASETETLALAARQHEVPVHGLVQPPAARNGAHAHLLQDGSELLVAGAHLVDNKGVNHLRSERALHRIVGLRHQEYPAAAPRWPRDTASSRRPHARQHTHDRALGMAAHAERVRDRKGEVLDQHAHVLRGHGDRDILEDDRIGREAKLPLHGLGNLIRLIHLLDDVHHAMGEAYHHAEAAQAHDHQLGDLRPNDVEIDGGEQSRSRHRAWGPVQLQNAGHDVDAGLQPVIHSDRGDGRRNGQVAVPEPGSEHEFQQGLRLRLLLHLPSEERDGLDVLNHSGQVEPQIALAALPALYRHGCEDRGQGLGHIGQQHEDEHEQCKLPAVGEGVDEEDNPHNEQRQESDAVVAVCEGVADEPGQRLAEAGHVLHHSLVDALLLHDAVHVVNHTRREVVFVEEFHDASLDLDCHDGAEEAGQRLDCRHDRIESDDDAAVIERLGEVNRNFLLWVAHNLCDDLRSSVVLEDQDHHAGIEAHASTHDEEEDQRLRAALADPETDGAPEAHHKLQVETLFLHLDFVCGIIRLVLQVLFQAIAGELSAGLDICRQHLTPSVRGGIVPEHEVVVWDDRGAVCDRDHADLALGASLVQKGLQAQVEGRGALVCQAEARLVKEHPRKVQALHLTDREHRSPIHMGVHSVPPHEVLKVDHLKQVLGPFLLCEIAGAHVGVADHGLKSAGEDVRTLRQEKDTPTPNCLRSHHKAFVDAP